MESDELPAGRLGELLRAAAAPGRPHELAGEDAAVAGFRRVYRPAKPLRRRLLATGAAAFAALSIGGTAYATGTGHLPDPVRDWIDGGHHAPSASTSPRATDRPSTTPSGRPSTGATSATGATGATATFAAADACRAFLAFRADSHARPLTEGERGFLARLAGGGDPAVDAYCRRLLGVTATPTPTPTDQGKPSHPAHPSHPAQPARPTNASKK
ncbi:hypothetical protein [Dactylosporangium sp. CA-139066]|uniref:hypothetical protein n=1 Tax=Dactylosporangium sp. CA-139066 TaxID=3239930 RepID=UPI003D946B7F